MLPGFLVLLGESGRMADWPNMAPASLCIVIRRTDRRDGLAMPTVGDLCELLPKIRWYLTCMDQQLNLRPSDCYGTGVSNAKERHLQVSPGEQTGPASERRGH